MSRLSKNVIYNLFGQGLLLVLSFISVKYIFKQLGEDALGIIYFTLTINAVLCAVLEMGICSTTVREVSAHFNDEPGYIRNFIRTASLFYWVAYILLAVIIYFVAPILVDKWINLKTIDAVTATQVLQILGISALFALPRSLYASLFRGLQRMEFNNLIDVASTALQQFGIIVILIIGGGLVSVAYWIAVSFGIGVLCYLLAARRFFPWQAFMLYYYSAVVRRNLGFSSRMMFISITSAVQTQADKVTISKLMPIGLVGYYGFAYGAVSKGTLLTGAISQAAFPSFSALFRAGDRKGLMTQYQKLQDLLCFAIVPIFAAIPFAVLPLFSYILNADTARLLLLPTTLLCVGFYMNGTLNIPYVFSLAVGKPGITARQHFYDLFVTLPATVILIYYLNIVGAGASLVFFYVFHYVYGLPRICSECLIIPVWKWYLHVIRIFVLIGLTYGVGWIILRFLGSYSIPYLASTYIGASIVFLIGAYFMIGDELRESLLQHFQSLRRLLINGF